MKKFTLLLAIFLGFSAFFSTQAQTITSFSPTSGLVGTTVTILGSSFSSITTNNVVQFNGLATVVIAATETSLTVTVPAGATTGSVSITVNSLTSSSSSVFTVLSTSSCNGISKNNAKHWYFGNQAAIKFENNIPVALTNSAMSQVEGVATMSDDNGNLLFYTNGITIFNRLHQIMENGSGLTSNSSNTQSAFIIPYPGNINKYYVFTPGPYVYCIVDMTMDNGNGAVIATEKNILLTNNNSEKIAGLLALNQTDIWVITYGANESRFNVYKISPSGIDTTPVVSQFTTASGFFGYMKISPDGTKIAMANFGQTFHLYDFDVATGVVSNKKDIPISIGGFGSYGIEFSPNNNLVYVADHRGQDRVFQYNITLATTALISSSVVLLAANGPALGGIQLGPDNKIYVAREGAGFLGVINNPDVIGTGCLYVEEAVSLAGRTSNLGLPGFVASALVQNQPYINSFTPISENIGATIKITGTDFSTVIANNIVTFNGVVATVLSVTATSLTVVVPVGATTGKISIEIGCSIVATTDNFTVTGLSTEVFSKSYLVISPNPSTGIFTIQTENPINNANLTVADMNGRIVYQTNAKNLDSKTVDLNNLSNGIYILNISNANYNYSQKLVKQ